MKKFNKEQWLFFFSCIVSVAIFHNYYRNVSNNTSYHQHKMYKDNISSIYSYQHQTVFAKSFYSYWVGSHREPFTKISEKKRLAPVKLSLPSVKIETKFVLPPIPCPSPRHWNAILSLPFSPLPDDRMLPNTAAIKKSLVQVKIPIISAFSKRMRTLVRKRDTVIMRNGRRFHGKIVNQNKQELVLHITKEQNSRSIVLPISQIFKISKKQDLSDLYKQEFRNIPKTDYLSLLKLAENCFEQRLYKLANSYFKKIIHDFPSFKKSYLSYTSFLIKRLKWNQAFNIFRKARIKNSYTEALMIKECSLLKKIGLKKQALNKLLLCETMPGRLLGLQVAFELHSWKIFKHLLLQARKHKQSKEFTNKLVFWQAKLALRQMQLEKCLTICEASGNAIKLANLKGVAYYLRGDLVKAAKIFQNLAEKGNTTAIYNLAITYWAGGQPKTALNLLALLYQEPEIIQDPSWVKAAEGYIRYNEDKNNNVTIASQILRSACDSNPENLFCHYLLGEIQKDVQGEREKAYRNYQRALKIDFSFTPSLMQLAVLCIQDQNFPDAMHYCHEALQRTLSPDMRAKVYAWLALAYQQNKQEKQAQKYISLAIKIRPHHPLAIKIQAWNYNQKGDIKNAIRCLNLLLTQNPNDSYLIQSRDKIILNQNLVRWEDFFSRADSNQVRKRWQELEEDGIEITLQKQQVYFSGTPIRGNIPSILTRLVSSQTFISFSIKLVGHQTDQTYMGICYGDFQKKLIYFGKNKKQQLVYAIVQAGMPIKWRTIYNKNKQSYTLGKMKENTLSIQRDRKKRAKYQLLYNDKVVMEVSWRELPGKKKINVGFYGIALAGEYSEMIFDNAYLLEKQKP